MPNRISRNQREEVLRLLAQGCDRFEIADKVGVTPGQVSAVSAHVKMGTYKLPPAADPDSRPMVESPRSAEVPNPRIETDLQCRPVLLGSSVDNGEHVYWSPDPASGLTNPHLMIIGDTGTGKTYSICCIMAELARRGVSSIVFDYGQGFSKDSLPRGFSKAIEIVEVDASRNGININPLQLFPTDTQGPINVAQRIADTFARVYSGLGIRQHAVLRQAVLETLARGGIIPEHPSSWTKPPPAFGEIEVTLNELASAGNTSQGRAASSAASHISTIFFFNTLRPNGIDPNWETMLASQNKIFVIQLKGLEYSLSRVVTEFLLWNFIGLVESYGPSTLKCFVVLDEAHKLSFQAHSPVERLLREGRKFGLGVMLASQHPNDFSSVAYANTATKLVFQVSDDNHAVSRQLHRRSHEGYTVAEIETTIARLPRGCAFVISRDLACIVNISKFEDRVNSWTN